MRYCLKIYQNQVCCSGQKHKKMSNKINPNKNLERIAKKNKEQIQKTTAKKKSHKRSKQKSDK